MPNARAHACMVEDAERQPRSLVRAKIGAACADLTRLVGRGLTLPLEHDVTLDVMFADAHSIGATDAVLLDGAYGALYLDAGVAFLLALTGVDIGAFDAAPLAQRSWLEAGVLGRLAGTPFDSATRLVRCPQPVDAPDHTVLALSLRDGSHVVSTLARADASSWLALLATQALQPLLAPQATFFALSVPLTVRIARHALAPAVLLTLGQGDVILPGQPDIDVHGEGWLRCANLLARVRYGRTGTVEFLSLEAAMDTPNDADTRAQLDAAPLDLDRTPLQLEFRLGAVALTLGQLRSIAAGSVFALDGAADGAVAIVCGGRRLGEGEPVDVDGRLGIRITRWDRPC